LTVILKNNLTQVDCFEFWCFISATNYTNLHELCF